jgi:hypothetical protein
VDNAEEVERHTNSADGNNWIIDVQMLREFDMRRKSITTGLDLLTPPE